MRRDRNIRGHLIKFYIGATDVGRRRQFYEGRINKWASAISLAPDSHLALLAPVPIIIVDALGPTRRTGSGWFPPSRPGYPLASIWRHPGRIRDCTHVPEHVLDQLGIDQGIIGVTTAACDASWWYLSPLHEMGHCIDWHCPGAGHRGLIPPRRAAYRHGNAPYQGQRYTRCIDLYRQACIQERAAETYSRYLASRHRMCRGSQGTPPCRSHSRDGCNRRLIMDLYNSPAFSGIPMPAPPPRKVRPPVGTTGAFIRRHRIEREPYGIAQINPGASFRTPQPLGLSVTRNREETFG